MSATGAAKFIGDLVAAFPVHFGPQGTEQEKSDYAAKRTAWMKSLMAELQSEDDVDLSEAASEIKRTRRDRRFPTISECLSACRLVKRQREVKSDSGTLKLHAAPTTGADYARSYWLADELLVTEQGRRAAREGWVLGFYHFVRDNNRAPSSADENRLRRAAELFNETHEECLRGGFVFAAALARLGDSMAARREELRSRALGGSDV